MQHRQKYCVRVNAGCVGVAKDMNRRSASRSGGELAIASSSRCFGNRTILTNESVVYTAMAYATTNLRCR